MFIAVARGAGSYALKEPCLKLPAMPISSVNFFLLLQRLVIYEVPPSEFPVRAG